MPKRFQLQDYDVEYHSQKRQTCIMITGERAYYEILKDAYLGQCKAIFNDPNRKYDWGVFIDSNEDEAEEIRDLLKMLTYAVCLQDNLHQSFALDYYYRPYWDDPEGGLTLAGSLVHQAKYFPSGTPEHVKTIDKLFDYFSRFISLHPSYRRSDYLVAVPFYGNKGFDLPTVITKRLCESFGIMSGEGLVFKGRATQSMKSLETKEEKQENIRGAFKLAPNAPFESKVITVIDDVYRSGTTITELANVLKAGGATVQGLVATKTIRD